MPANSTYNKPVHRVQYSYCSHTENQHKNYCPLPLETYAFFHARSSDGENRNGQSVKKTVPDTVGIISPREMPCSENQGKTGKNKERGEQ
jgi:hypothetical protein